MTDLALSPQLGTLRDQRTMVGGRTHSSVEDVERGYEEWIARHGLPVRRRSGDYSTDLRRSRKRPLAYVSAGKWIADCPACNGGIAVWIENPRGVCLDCGTVYSIDHASPHDAEAAARLLSVRPDPRTRHWLRHRGETIDDLATENRDLLRADPDEQAVAVSDVARVLGDDALSKLRDAGLVNDDLIRLREAGLA